MTKPINTTRIKLSTIVDTEIQTLQMRESLDHTHVDDLKDCLDQLPPITVFADPITGKHHIADGWHRYHAHKLSNKKEIAAEIHAGGPAEALKYALGANAEHNALRRTNRDKRKAVKIALGAYNTHSNREIAKLCRVTEGLVRLVKKELEPEEPDPSDQSDPSDPPPGTTDQIDFFAQLNASFKPVEDGMQEVLNHSYFLNEDVPTTEKVDALKGIESKFAEKLQEAKDLRLKLEKQEA